MIKKYDFKDELSKNYVYDVIKTTGEFVMNDSLGRIPLRRVYDLQGDRGLVAIIKTDDYDEEYKKVDKYLVINPDLILIGPYDSLKNFMEYFKERKINFEEYNSNKRNEEALER